MAEKIAKVYAGAVFDSVKKSGKLEQMNSDINELEAILKDNPDFMKLLKNPDISLQDKQSIIENVFRGKLLDELYGLCQLLLQKDRIGSLEEILEELVVMYKEEMLIGVVYVKTPAPLKKEQAKALENKIIADTKYKTLEMHFEVDEALIAGMVIRIGDRVVDSSVATRLENMTRRLKTLQIK